MRLTFRPRSAGASSALAGSALAVSIAPVARSWLAVTITGIAALGLASSARAAAKPIRSYGNATVVSVDGPARLTLKTGRGRLAIRLYMVDAPEPDECGAAEGTAALKRLTKGRRARVRYVTFTRKPDAEGRLSAVVGPRGADLVERSVARDLVATDWARTFPSVSISPSDNISLSVASERFGPRKPQGLWTRCGGYTHLPASEPAPAHAPVPWTITADGITQAIGPIVPAAAAPPGAPLRVADLARIVRVEVTDPGGPTCWPRIPSLELKVYATVDRKKGESCATGAVEAIVSSGPGYVSTTLGLRVGQTVAEARTLFPRLASVFNEQATRDTPLRLAGDVPAATPWQTLAGRRERNAKIVGFLTSPVAWDT